ncbi:xylogen-like protein 10 [Corchorus capsularis]|uniref:Xylogen-like protein 10 n=1 Tax=Corchorus capsularis TaxID=210143 RepID=A0A1R3GTT9_COCAP|nr:xylogen-like protein 10 [Corchorus capsularis]
MALITRSSLFIVVIVISSCLVSKGDSKTEGLRHVWENCVGYLSGRVSEVSPECCGAYVKTYETDATSLCPLFRSRCKTSLSTKTRVLSLDPICGGYNGTYPLLPLCPRAPEDVDCIGELTKFFENEKFRYGGGEVPETFPRPFQDL